MIKNYQQLIAILPILITGITLITLMICISWKRNHLISAVLTFIGLNLAFISLWLVFQNGPIDVNSLIRIDNFSIFYTGLILLSSIFIISLSYSWLTSYFGNRDEFYLLIIIATIGGIVLTSTNHLAILCLGVELMSLPLVGMIGYIFNQKKSLEASIKYMLLSSIALSFFIFGSSLIYAQTGQLSFIALGKVLNDVFLKQNILLIGISLIIVAFNFKLSLVPFHLWTPDVYQGAPTIVTIFLTIISKIAIFAVCIRLFLYAPFMHSNSIHAMFTFVSFISILFGNLMALNQKNIKRLLGYSSISHYGYLIINLILLQTNTVLVLEAISIYLISYLFANLGIFSTIDLISKLNNKKNYDDLSSYRGLFWHKPFLSIIFTLMILSLAGMPITLGFIGKFYIITLCINNNLNWLLCAIVISSAIGMFYYLRIIINLYLSPLTKYHRDNYIISWEVNFNHLILLISSLLILILGIYPQPIISLVKLFMPII